MTVHVLSAYSLRLRLGNFELLLDNSDRFINIRQLAVEQWALLGERRTHGLLGQTWRAPAVLGRQVRHVEGDIDDYVERDGDLFGRNFMYDASEQ